MSYKILSLIDKQEWKDYLNRLSIEQQDIYYTPEYYSLYENYGDGEAQCFVFEKDGDIALYPFLLNLVNKLGYQLDKEYFDIQGVYGYNGVISSNYDKEFIDEFYDAFDEWCQKNNIIAEFTRFHPMINNFSFSKKKMKVIKDRKTVYVDIPKDIEDIWGKSYSSNNRNMIRKARKRNVKIIETTQEKYYQLFYEIYCETMDNVRAEDYLYFNVNYIIDFYKLLPSNHKLILAKYEDQVIGGMILMIYNNYAHYHLSARKSEYGSFALNNLFLDYAINIAHRNNCKQFHFGGGTSSNENDSLLKFKSNFSKERADFYIGKKIHNQQVYDQVVRQWKEKRPESYQKNRNLLLGYREI